MNSLSRILVADDEENVRKLLAAVLTREGCQVVTVSDGREAVEQFRKMRPDIVLMDIRMPGLNGIESLKEIRSIAADATVILMTAYASMETAVEALRQGAFDYVIKPFDLGEVKLLIERALQMRDMKQEIRILRKELSESLKWGHFLTANPRMMELCRDTAKIAQSSASVLITGESGTGKELIAKAIHYNSARAKGPFIKINCGALTETLLESELFGHEKGAFTGAQMRKAGLFERANLGTVFLDEVGEMSRNLQVKLLRVLQEREFERVGGNETIRTDIRLIAATNRDLNKLIKESVFRSDLYYRLNVIHLTTLPLRERPEDIPLLAGHFLQKFCSENNKDIIGFDDQTLEIMQNYPWPGNVRELANAMERAVIMCLGMMIFPEDLPESIVRFSVPAPDVTDEPDHDDEEIAGSGLKDKLKDYERDLIQKVLQAHHGNRMQAAKSLGISRRSLMYKLQEYNIE